VETVSDATKRRAVSLQTVGFRPAPLRTGTEADAMPAHIMVLEDDEGLRYSHCKILENVGYVPRPSPDFRNFLEPLVPGVMLHAVEASLPTVRDRIVPPSAGATSLIQDAETVGV
jgi:hypothetical protein